MEKEDKTTEQKPPSLDLSNLEDPKEKDFITNILKVCWRGMRYDEETKVFSPDPNGH